MSSQGILRKTVTPPIDPPHLESTIAGVTTSKQGVCYPASNENKNTYLLVSKYPILSCTPANMNSRAFGRHLPATTGSAECTLQPPCLYRSHLQIWLHSLSTDFGTVEQPTITRSWLAGWRNRPPGAK